MFIDPNQRVPISDDSGNTIYIKAKMDSRTRAAIMDEIGARGLVEGEAQDIEVSGIGSYRLALLLHNIVAWEGPDYLDQRGRPLPCNRFNISRLDPDDPLLERVAEEIGKRNRKLESPDPNSPTASGSTSAGG